METIRIAGRGITLESGDITTLTADAIVNAANPSLMGGGGVDGAIHRAGGPSILQECEHIVARNGLLRPGRAVMTGAGSLSARHVIHTVGPVWRGGGAGEAATLASAYRECLRRAEERALGTIAFPSISTGAYGYPVEPAAEVALGEVARFLVEEARSVVEVTFVLHDETTYRAYSQALTGLGAAVDGGAR